jgi:hypothetical protein
MQKGWGVAKGEREERAREKHKGNSGTKAIKDLFRL